MSKTDLERIFGKAREMESRVAGLQRDLARRRFEGAAGGGMVEAVCSGDLKVLEIRIEPALHAQGDLSMLQDLIAAAVNAAMANAQRGVQEELQRTSGGLDLAGLFSPDGGNTD